MQRWKSLNNNSIPKTADACSSWKPSPPTKIHGLCNGTNLMPVLVWFVLIWFYNISTIVGYLTPNPIYVYILNMISKHISQITFLNDPELIFHSVKWFILFISNTNICIYY